MISFCPPALNPSRPLSKIKTLRENRKRTNSWPDVFRRFKSWGVLQAAVCLLCKVELSGKIKMAESQVRLLLDIKRTKYEYLYLYSYTNGKSWKWSELVKRSCKPVFTRILDMQFQFVQKIDRNNHRPLLILVCNGPQSKNSMITLLWKTNDLIFFNLLLWHI